MNKWFYCFLLLIPTDLLALDIIDSHDKVLISTQKVVKLYGSITESSDRNFEEQSFSVLKHKGDLVVLINSTGGLVEEGQNIIDFIEDIKLSIAVLCVVMNKADSMAFNILSHCNTRYYLDGSNMVVHKVALSRIKDDEDLTRYTAKKLRQIAHNLDIEDEPYRQLNSKLMGLSLSEYDMYADNETSWSGKSLYKRRYFQDNVRVVNSDSRK